MLALQKLIRWGKENIKEAKETKVLTWVSTKGDAAKVSLKAAAQQTMEMDWTFYTQFKKIPHPHVHRYAHTCRQAHT